MRERDIERERGSVILCGRRQMKCSVFESRRPVEDPNKVPKLLFFSRFSLFFKSVCFPLYRSARLPPTQRPIRHSSRLLPDSTQEQRKKNISGFCDLKNLTTWGKMKTERPGATGSRSSSLASAQPSAWATSGGTYLIEPISGAYYI